MGLFTSIKAASLTALTFVLIATGAFAAESDYFYKAQFVPQSPFGGDVNLRLQNGVIRPLLVLAEDSTQASFPVRFNFYQKNIDLMPSPLSFRISSLEFYYEADEGDESMQRTRVRSDRREVDGIWDIPVLASTGILLDVTDSLSIGQVGSLDTHKVGFTTSTTPIADSGIVWVVFPFSFNINNVTNAIYTDNDPSNDSSEPTVIQIDAQEHSLLFHLSYNGQQAIAGSRINLTFWPVTNDTVSEYYSVLVLTTRENSEVENGPTDSAPFGLLPGPLHHLLVVPNMPISMEAGSFIPFAASGRDIYNNPISGLPLTYDVSVDSCGQIIDNNFRAAKTGSTYIIISAQDMSDSTGLITVIPGPLDRFSIGGYPSTRTAGQPFSQNITVAALDAENNRKYDYLGQIWFVTSDTIDDLPYEEANRYTFTALDSGDVAFPGPGFALKRAGVRTITATNETTGAVSGPIRVNPAVINRFLMSAGLSQVAGQSFYVSVDSAIDLYGNMSAGEITVSDSVGGGNSPDGISPSYNRIVVTGGIGQAMQTLTYAIPTRLKGVLFGGSVRNATGLIQVLPGVLGRYVLERYPDIIAAGDTFPQEISVSAKDIFGNLKINYDDNIYFTATDSLALLPYTQSSPFHFLSEYQGTHLFPEPFSFRTTGRQYLTVTNGTVDVTSNVIIVSPDVITAFTLASPDSVVAGQAFALSVSNAVDQWGNAANGTLAVVDSLGGGASPDGIPPILSQITVVDGAGQGLQVLVIALPTMLKAYQGDLLRTTGLIQVLPGTLARFEVEGFPFGTVAGDTFAQDITVYAIDQFGNLKINYNDTVYFTSTDPQPLLPYTQAFPFHFGPQYLGVHAFGGPFSLRTAGGRFIAITDGVLEARSPSITVAPDIITAFALVTPDTVVAGQAFTISAIDAVDQWGNDGNGTVAVSDSVGGGSSPDGVPPTHNQIVISNGAGDSPQILTNAVPTVLKGILMQGNFRTATSTIQVRPTALGRFVVTGYVENVTAGDTLPPPISVSVFDQLGNPKTDYDDSVYFTSSDPQALLPYTLASPFHFSSQYAGVYAFTESFSLRTAGMRRIFFTDGVLEVSSPQISVSPNIIDDFALSAPLTIAAGMPFALSAQNVRDLWGNAASGIIAVTDSLGGGPSPNGSQPVLADIQVVSGSGSATQTLYNADSTTLSGAAGAVVRVTGNIDVTPGTLAAFDFDLSSPQISGVPFSGTALVTAFDYYGNLKTNYDASADSVVITSSAGGDMDNNILRLPSDFQNGAADLATIGTTFNGRGGPMTFRAASRSGVVASSGSIDMIAMECASLVIDQPTISHGDTATGTVSVNNLAGVNLDVTALTVLDHLGWSVNPVVAPPLPYQLGPGQSLTFFFQFDITVGYPFGVHALTAAAQGDYSSIIVFDTIPGYPDTLVVVTAAFPGYVANSIYPETLSTGSSYTLSFRLSNTGTTGMALYDSSYYFLTDGIHQFRAAISAPLYLPPDSPQGVAVTLNPTTVDTAFIPGDYQGTFYFYGIENGQFREGQFPVTDSVTIQARATLAYIPGSLSIDSMVAGQREALNIQIQNTGNADFIVDHQNTRISFNDSQHEYVAHSDTSSQLRVDTLSQGTTSFYFANELLPVDFISGRYRPSVVFSGMQNGHAEIVTFGTGNDSIKVLTPATLRIDSTNSLSHNAPIVNVSQACSVRVMLENVGDEAAESLYVRLQNSGQSIFPDSIYLPRLGGHEADYIVFLGTAGPLPDPNEVLASALSGGWGAVSGNMVGVLQPLDNTALLVIETPANVNLSPLVVTAPPEAADDTISTGQEITLSTTVRNTGQAGFGGARRLLLDVGVLGWEADSLTRDFQPDQPVSWRLTAPTNTSDSAMLTVYFMNRLTDDNDGSTAFGPDSTASKRLVIDSSPFITHNAAITSPGGAVDGEISTDQLFIVTDTLFAYGAYDIKGARITLPAGFTTDDSLVKYPEGNTVSWHLRAPSSIGGTSITLTSWVRDANSGDSISGGVRFVQVNVVRAALLSVSSRIAGPPSAIDGIVQPDGHVLIEALVRNGGDADVGSGQVRLRPGRSDMIPAENPIRDFTADTPLTWDVSVPSVETPQPVPLSVIMQATPLDENTGLPAAVQVDSTAVTVLIRELYPKLVMDNVVSHGGSVAKGQSLIFLTFDVRNNDFGGNFPIAVCGFNFDVVSNPPALAADLITAAQIVSDSATSAAVTFDQNTFAVSIPDSIYIGAGGGVQFALSITISSGTPVRDFTIRIGPQSADAQVIENGAAVQELPLVNPSGEPMAWESDPTAVVEQSFRASISSYPNPFSPQDGGTRIGYYLPAPANLEVRILTLLGELVWTKNISASEPMGGSGLHTGGTALIWDGRNDIGREVRSGIYICIIRNLSSGEEEKFKIAVVK